jgi:hypothetical protein
LLLAVFTHQENHFKAVVFIEIVKSYKLRRHRRASCSPLGRFNG